MITFLKELFQIIWMLFSSKPSKFNRLQLRRMEKFPFSGHKYMSWCGYLVHKMDNIEEYMKKDKWRVDENHENIHLGQAKKFKFWLTYYVSYLWEIIKYNPFSDKAYYLNSYEMEAYANENNLDYSKSYTGEYLHVYKEVKDKGKIWKELGCSSRKWKEYIKTIKLE